MTPAEEGILLLCCRLGQSGCRPLTMAQFRDLGIRVRHRLQGFDGLRLLRAQDLIGLGYSRDEAERMLSLLERICCASI